MALRHYYVEDRDVDPKREDKVAPVRSIQFDLLPSGDIYVNIDEPSPSTGGLVRASVVIPIEEIKNAYDWLIEGKKDLPPGKSLPKA